ncbi:lactadherin-like isoform X2 [Xenia sp. Carnegie-2017]|uniref:lactadherin-like isoform X2 n=1 Tax=Xenia sp. Carnegie-2017 TaxID=2897299 RepID=UPI001F0448BC|nr:lactadherin-like isoform X2 [Xenia sp. Carnegie-2017]
MTNGWLLHECIIEKIDVPSEIECILSCVNTPCCRSVNYRIGFSDKKAENYSCELLDGIHDENSYSNLQRNGNYIYIFSVSPKKCFNRTCAQSKVCINPKALGMENREISDAQITASSEYDTFHGKSNARLNCNLKSGSWSARKNDKHQWLQVDFRNRVTITEIQTQGRESYHNQYVKTYSVSYSDDGTIFKSYKNEKGIKEFVGNFDMHTIVDQKLCPVIISQYIRIHPMSWNNHISMRLEFVGCLRN